MKKFQKSTPEEIAKMKVLYKKGWGLSKIARKLNKDHSSIFYHVKGMAKPAIKDTSHYFNRGKKKPEKEKRISPIYDGVGENKGVPDYIRKNLELEEKERKNAIIEKEKRKKIGNCIVCGKKIRSLKFKKTKFCSLKCFTNYNL